MAIMVNDSRPDIDPSPQCKLCALVTLPCSESRMFPHTLWKLGCNISPAVHRFPLQVTDSYFLLQALSAPMSTLHMYI